MLGSEKCLHLSSFTSLIFSPLKLKFYMNYKNLCNQSSLSIHLSVSPSIFRCKYFNIRHYVQTFQPNSSKPVMVISTIDTCHFKSLSVNLTLAEGHKVCGQQILWASFCKVVGLIWDVLELIWCKLVVK